MVPDSGCLALIAARERGAITVGVPRIPFNTGDTRSNTVFFNWRRILMSTRKLTFLMIGLVVLALLSVGPAMAADLSGKKVVVVSGVAKARNEATGYNLYQDGIKEILDAVGIPMVLQWAEMTYATNEEEKIKAGDLAIANVKAAKPDVIIVLDDDALKYIGARIDDIPIVFAFVFGDPKGLGMPKDNVTGIIRKSYAVDNWCLAKKLFPEIKTVGLLSKYSLPMEGVKQFLAAKAPYIEKGCGILYKDTFMSETFEDWEKAVKAFPYDLIYLADTSRLTKDGKELPRREACQWTVDNAKVPVIAAVESDVEGGGLFAIVTSERNIGQMAAQTAIEIINGAAPSQEYKQGEKGKLVINIKTAQKYNLDIPYEILSTAERVIE